MQIDRDEYKRMYDRFLPPKGACSGSHDLFKLWQISGNTCISETVAYK